MKVVLTPKERKIVARYDELRRSGTRRELALQLVVDEFTVNHATIADPAFVIWLATRELAYDYKVVRDTIDSDSLIEALGMVRS